MASSDIWGELRALLAQPYTRASFLQIWEALGSVPDKDLLSAALIPYVREALDRKASEGVSPEQEMRFLSEGDLDLSDPRVFILDHLYVRLIASSQSGSSWVDTSFVEAYSDTFAQPSSLRSLSVHLRMESLLEVDLSSLWAAIANMPFFANLERFSLDLVDFGGIAIMSPLPLSSLSRLKSLECTRGPFTPEDWGNLLKALSPHPASQSSLEHLSLWGSPYGDAYCSRLAQSPWLTNLKSLGLGRTRLTCAGVALIAAYEHFKNLEHLHLSYNDALEGAIPKPLYFRPEILQTLRGRGLTWGD